MLLHDGLRFHVNFVCRILLSKIPELFTALSHQRLEINLTLTNLKTMVGLGRLELPTPRLSSAYSNQLSYRPSGKEHMILISSMLSVTNESLERKSGPNIEFIKIRL